MTIGEKIKKFRTERGLTQKQLGELCNMLEATIRKYELGKANPKIETIITIANALKVSVFDLRGDLTFGEQWEIEKKAMWGVQNIIADLFGRFLYVSVAKDGDYDNYILLDDGKEMFILQHCVVDELVDTTRTAIKSQVEQMRIPVDTPELREKIEKDLVENLAYQPILKSPK